MTNLEKHHKIIPMPLNNFYAAFSPVFRAVRKLVNYTPKQ
jgi:hypothetical protein